MSKRYTFKPKAPSVIPEVDDLALINDDKWKIAIRTAERIREFRLSRTVTPTLNIPLYWNPQLKAFELGYYGSIYLLNAQDKRINPATEDTLALINTKLDSLDVALSSRASESTLSALNSKIQTQTADLFVKDVSVETTAVQLDTDSAYRDEIIILADPNNTDVVKVGTSTSQLFPLAAGASVAIRKTALNLIFAVAISGTQILHVIAGGC
jgi:hypothetical protein